MVYKLIVQPGLTSSVGDRNSYTVLRELPAASDIFVTVVAVCDRNCRLGRQSNSTKPSGDLLAQCEQDAETQVSPELSLCQ